MAPGKSKRELGALGERLAEKFLRKLGYKLIDHRLELYGVPMEEYSRRR